MRSVYVHLHETTEAEAAAFLSSRWQQDSTAWVLPRDRAPVLTISIWSESAGEFEPQDWQVVTEALGGEPEVTVVADVGGRQPGDAEVREFAGSLLAAFRGVAQDDHTSHCWTRAEIETGACIQGHPFFDYRGWYEEERVDSNPEAGGLSPLLQRTRRLESG